jgi:UDP-N-acetylmuramoyl-tripeptide--D-alanyl-D-alanine ligase
VTGRRIDLGWALSDVAARLGGTLVGGDGAVTSVSTDSRSVEPGALFVAILGGRFDGHDYAEAAIEAGAVGAVVERDRGVQPVPRIEVDSTADALLGLAAIRRSELTMPVIAITWSSGKTSTKDLVAAGLEGSWASPRSYNNEVGVPLTVLATPDDASALVLEVGSRGVGHIRWLGDAIRPDVSVVTVLGVAHLETFGSEPNLADAKYELVELLGGDGVAVVPADEPRLHRGGTHRQITFGPAGSVPPADIEYADVRLDDRGSPHFRLIVEGRAREVALAVSGAHQAANAAAAAAVASALRVDLDGFLDRMCATTGSEWRMDIHEGRYVVVNDAYNANPQSVEAALRTITEMPHRKTIAVLGAMAELGSVCEAEHRRMGALASALGIDVVVVVGPDHGYSLGAPELIRNVADSEEAADTLHAVVEPGDVVLVKASRAGGLERLALDLAEDATA